MSPRQMVVNARQLIKVLEKLGYTLDRHSGSHAIFRKTNYLPITVPVHGKRDIAPGTLRQILRDAGITLEDLKNLL